MVITGRLSTGTRKESQTFRVIVTGWSITREDCGGERKRVVKFSKG